MAAAVGATHSSRGAEPWGVFLAILLGASAALLAATVLALLAIDPYDTGRSGLFRAAGLGDQSPVTANASRGRDPRFDSAVIGNSHVQMLKPERLDRLTGYRFVSLMLPGTQPGDQLDMLRWFAAHHAAPRAIILGMDPYWCGPETAGSSGRFPAWLYADSFVDYATGLVRYRAIEAAAARLFFLLGRRPALRPDGYWDYGPVYEALGLADAAASARRLATVRPFAENPTREFPALERLTVGLSRLPSGTRVALLRPPLYRSARPGAGTAGEAAEAACRARMAAVASARPGTTLVDLFAVAPGADEPGNFYDHDHIREAFATTVEKATAAALVPEAGEGGRPAFD